MKRFKVYTNLFFLCSLFVSNIGFCQLTVTPSLTAAALAGELAGPGIAISAPTLTCATVANGSFVSVGTPLSIDSGILLTTGKAIQASGPETFLASTNNGTPGDPALAGLALTTTLFDACILEFDFVPNGDTVSFNYQFGSNEYRHSNCGPYNDAFAFFISGPGITGTVNLALIPGTTIPVTVNSVNSGTPGPGYTLANCTAMGPGCPYSSDYIDNIGGLLLSYCGFTTKFTATSPVTPCSTYHLKITITDAGNALYDSGVFLEAGSLKTNTVHFDHLDSIGATVDGVPNTIVKGCSPATVTVQAAHVQGSNQTVYFSFGGTAVQNVDYTAPDSAIITAGDTSVSITITGIPTPPAGTKTLEMYLLSPFSCGIVDSITLNIMDTPSAYILTPDTTVCSGTSFPIRTLSTAGLSYTWSPVAGLSSSTVMEPTASPATTTTYVMTATLPNSGCPAMVRDVTVSVINTTISMLTPNTTICLGGSVPMNVSGSATLDYNWTPAAGLSNPFIQNPVAIPAATTVYTVTASGAGGVCPYAVSVTITVADLSLSLLTPDTTICIGASVGIRAYGTASGPTYSWSPSVGLSNPAIIDPVASPTITTTYYLTDSWPGSACPSETDSVRVTVINSAISILTPDTLICYGSSVEIRVDGSSTNSYYWAPTTGLNNAGIQDPIASPLGTTVYTVTALSAGGLCTSQAMLTVALANPSVAILTNDTTICAGSSIQLLVNGDSSQVFVWMPSTGLSAANIMDPVASPAINTTYIMTASVPGTPCSVTDSVTINVSPSALANVTITQTIPYGSSIQLNADSSLYYFWTPDDGSLNNPNINNPIATPLAPTTYTVTATNLYGCRTTASVTIDLTYENIFIPNAFTPNGDGLNDVFRVGNLGPYRLEEMSVYNRWGNLIYHVTDGDNKGWDGTFKGVPQDMGVYNYFIIIGRPEGGLQTYKGNVTLLR